MAVALVPVSLWVVLVFSAAYLFCLGFLLPDITALIMEPFEREQAGSASALLGISTDDGRRGGGGTGELGI